MPSGRRQQKPNFLPFLTRLLCTRNVSKNPPRSHNPCTDLGITVFHSHCSTFSITFSPFLPFRFRAISLPSLLVAQRSSCYKFKHEFTLHVRASDGAASFAVGRFLIEASALFLCVIININVDVREFPRTGPIMTGKNARTETSNCRSCLAHRGFITPALYRDRYSAL